MIEYIAAVAVSLLYAACVEYSMHRWMMHFPGLGKNKWWYEHAVEHHGHKRNDINIALSPFSVLVLASPLFIGCVWFGLLWALYVIAACCGYAGLWTALHSAYHEVGHGWIAQGWYYRQWKAHHMAHHEHPSCNFGTVFIWSDRIAGTRWQSA